jgi:hypothetical protein
LEGLTILILVSFFFVLTQHVLENYPKIIIPHIMVLKKTPLLFLNLKNILL